MDLSSYEELESFTNLLIRKNSVDLVDDYNDFEATFEAENSNVVSPAARKKVKRTVSFTHEEDALLIAAYLHTSKDPATGNGQNATTFWGRIMQYIEENGGFSTPRSLPTMKTRWRDINKQCSKFVGVYKQIESLNQSGQNELGKLRDAYKEYHRQVGKSFTCQHCWEILKKDPKWQATLSNKRQKITTDENSVASDGANQDRSMDMNASKEVLTDKGKCIVGSASSFLTLEFFEQNEKSENREKADRQERMLLQHQQQLDLQQACYEMSIMQQNTTGMSPQEAAYFESIKQEILKKRGF